MKTIIILLLSIFLSGCSFNSLHDTEFQMDNNISSDVKIRDIVKQVSQKYDLEEKSDLPEVPHPIVYCSDLGIIFIIAIRAYNDENIIIVSLREGKLGLNPSERYIEIRNDLTKKLKDTFGDKVLIKNNIEDMKSKYIKIH